MGLFSKTKEGFPWNAFQWATNAPAHWPPVYCTNLREDQHLMNLLHFIDNVFKSWEAVPGCTVKVSTLGKTFLDGNGVLWAPLAALDGTKEYPIFVYEKSNSDAAAHFAGVQKFLATRGISPVYYAPKPLKAAPQPGFPFRDLWIEDFSIENSAGPPEPFSMWWPTRPDERFSGSTCAIDIDRTMRALDGYNTIVFAGMGEHFKTRHAGRAPLPTEPVIFYTKGPEGRPVAISVSSEKGIRFHFPEESTPPGYRDAFWHAFAKSAENFRNVAITRVVWDPPGDRQGLSHWEQVFRIVQEQEASSEFEDAHIGNIILFPLK